MINLNQAYNDSCIFFHNDQDVTCLKLGNNINNMISYKHFVTKKSKISKIALVDSSNVKYFNDVLIGNDIFIFGYPASLGIRQDPQFDYLRPLARKGIIAGKNIFNNTIILDCPAYPGNSGGPVFGSYPRGLSTEFFIIGILSEFIPFTQTWVNTRHRNSYTEISNSGYSVVVPIDRIYEILPK